MATTIDRISRTFLASRNQSPYLNKHLKPIRLCFSNFGSSFPKSSLQRKIVPLLDVDFASSSSSINHIFVHDRRLTKPVRTLRASKDENSIPGAANVLLKRLFLTFNIIMGMLLLAISEFFPLIELNRRLGMYFMMVFGLSCIWCLVDSLLCVMAGIYRLIHVIISTFNWPVLRTLLYYSFIVLKELLVFYCKLRICEFCLGIFSLVMILSDFK
ncbi:unnamed protein product [Arabidopsis lyrata]|uniref:Predicted protein n=1 Tax=Arabidopsis lyrata subsp. lyrata TaxID=81972 RepID=D7M2Q3_ARALL|nr:uncharacterized protein LOC9310936 [Arabidopsis lyrata subsp. lyrata]EFH51128.1 predicted protein [Arabidopsis lyrata subsp. lyrata]CAH8273312.1 unnamed protein product [Arabidopsis lyrata]|eukprot:XP_002874869.1 uncharacterized protein LOC9310936 [Arabidopsis lyrata subsp. lyrata]